MTASLALSSYSQIHATNALLSRGFILGQLLSTGGIQAKCFGTALHAGLPFRFLSLPVESTPAAASFSAAPAAAASSSRPAGAARERIPAPLLPPLEPDSVRCGCCDSKATCSCELRALLDWWAEVEGGCVAARCTGDGMVERASASLRRSWLYACVRGEEGLLYTTTLLEL